MKAFILFLMALALASTPLSAQLPNITNQPASRALWAGGNVTFAVGVSNAGAFTFQWQLNSTNIPNNIITTIVGSGSHGYSGDGGSALNAGLEAFGVVVDAVGNLFIADRLNHRIRKVDTNGIISTVAGTGEFNTYGDNIPATNSGLSYPQGVKLDSVGNLLIADSGYGAVREVDGNGIIHVIAGQAGSHGFSGDDGFATNAQMRTPVGIELDSAGALYISDYSDHRIRKVDTNGIITTFAGNGVWAFSGDGGPATNASFAEPSSLALDRCGNMYIADFNNNRIRQVDTSGMITTFAGHGSTGFPPTLFGGDGGPATNAYLSGPEGISIDLSGNLFIADQGNHRIRKIDTNGIIMTVAGRAGFGYSGDGGFATNATLYIPNGVAVDTSGNLFIADEGNDRIRKVINTRGPTLMLNNVSTADSGSYRLMVTGPDGGVTSSIANLIVATSPLIYQTTRNSDGKVALNFVSQPGSTNVVLCATNLASPVVWQTLSTNLAGPDGNWQFTDTNAASYQTRFYRSPQK